MSVDLWDGGPGYRFKDTEDAWQHWQAAYRAGLERAAGVACSGGRKGYRFMSREEKDAWLYYYRHSTGRRRT